MTGVAVHAPWFYFSLYHFRKLNKNKVVIEHEEHQNSLGNTLCRLKRMEKRKRELCDPSPQPYQALRTKHVPYKTFTIIGPSHAYNNRY